MEMVLMGDLHVFRLWTWPWLLLSKRVLGQTNLWLNRRSRFDLGRLPTVIDHAGSLKATHFLQLGDLTTTALSSEFKLAARYLRPLIQRTRTTIMIPGNHDRYTFTSSRDRRFERYFGAYAPSEYPWRQRIADEIYLFCLDPTRPRIFDASGRMGSGQLSRFSAGLERVPRQARVIVACHYPIAAPPGFAVEKDNHRLRDAEALIEILRSCSREILYLHGHVHQPWCWRLEQAPGVVALNAGAPIMQDPLHPGGQGFWSLHPFDDSPAYRLRRHVLDEANRWSCREIRWPRRPGEVAPVA